MLLRILLAVLSGFGMALAFAPWGLFWTLPIGIAGLMLLSHHRTVPRVLLPGLGFGVGFMYVHLWWMRAVGPDAWLALASLEAVFFVLCAAGFALTSRLPGWPVWATAVYVGVEVLRGSWPLSGMPWGRLSYAAADTPWAAALPWLGMTGVSVLVAATGATLAWLVLRLRSTRRPRALLPGLVAVAAIALVTTLPHLVTLRLPAQGSVHVAAVQGNVPGDGTNVLLDHRQVTENHVEATMELAADVEAGRRPAPDFVVWPENSTAVDPFADAGINAGIRSAVRAIGVPVLVGAMVDGPVPGTVLNQGIVWRPGLGAGDRYTKRHPVPFGEYVPWRGTLFTSNFGRLEMIPRDMYSGTRSEPLTIAGTEVADALCFDVAYDDGIHAQVSEGATLLVVQTSNAMFIETPQIQQQFEISRLRAIETGKYVVVAAINGVSGVIAPDGTVIARGDVREQEVLVSEVVLHGGTTPAVDLGPWPGRAMLALGTLGMAAGLLRRRPARARRARSTDSKAIAAAPVVPVP